MPTVLVTGASKGIGLAVATILLRQGANVVAFQRSRTPDLVSLASDNLLIIDGDVADEKAAASAIQQAVQKFGALDGVIFNAAKLDPLTRRVIFVSSGASVKGTAAWGPYNASKAAMNSLCRTLAQEEPDVVSVAVRPGMVDTEMQGALREIGAAEMKPQDHESFVSAHANGKLLNPEDPGHVVACLALKASKNLSGEFVSWDSDECAPYRV
ncbi:Short-chain dehydrogenase/reductase family protein [Mycena kentingensis (nom. inval.)]|nr:Short-chain dehydrogenase/reductase family protein [Mycena kentingensis (nom. inval.)]